MSRATSVALINLLSHANSIEQVEVEMSRDASRELNRMQGLLNGHETDLNILEMIPVNSKLLPNAANHQSGGSTNHSKQPSTSTSTPPSTATPPKERTLGDYVSRVKMGAVANSCQRVYSELSSRLSIVKENLSQLKVDTSGLRSEVESTDIQPSFSTLEDSVSALERSKELISFISKFCSPDPQGWPAADYLSSTQPNSSGFLTFEKIIESSKELFLLDEVVRESFRRLNQDLNDMLVRSLHLLQDISALQSDYADAGTGLTSLEMDLKSNKLDGFKHLARLKNMLWAYGATVVECVRRREFGEFVGSGSPLGFCFETLLTLIFLLSLCSLSFLGKVSISSRTDGSSLFLREETSNLLSLRRRWSTSMGNQGDGRSAAESRDLYYERSWRESRRIH